MRPARPIRGSNGPFPDTRFDRLGPSGSGWLVRAGSDLPGRDGWFRGARNRGSPHQIPPFYGPEMADFGRFPGFRISDAPPTYSPVLMYLEIQVLGGFPELERRNSALLRHREIQFFATSTNKFPHFDGPRFWRRGLPDLSADRKVRFRTPGSTDSGIPGRDGWFRGARNRGFPFQIPPFYGPEMTDFG